MWYLLAAVRGFGGGVVGIVLGVLLGNVVLRVFGLVFEPWEMAALVVPVLCAIDSVFAGAIGAAIGNRLLAACAGALAVGGFLTYIVMTNGSPIGTAVWSVIVAITSGAVAGAVRPTLATHVP